MTDIKSIILSTPSESLEKILSPFIEEQFPSFIKSDYRKLILFIKAYYEWMEKEGNPGFVNYNLDSVYDIDKNLEEFYSYFKHTFMDSFCDLYHVNTQGFTPNKKTLLKKIRQFYGSKGTESAYRFLFRLFFDSNLQVGYPQKQILRASDGKWVEQVSIKVTRNNESLHEYMVGGQVQQYNADGILIAYALVDKVFKYYQDGVPVTELYLTNLTGNFLPNATTTMVPFSDTGVDSFTETSFSVLGDFFIQTPGSNYKVGDTVFVSADGVGFSAKVQQTGLDGGVKKIQIDNSGVNYFNTVTALVVGANGQNSNSIVVLTPTAITRYPGYYVGNSGKISSTNKIYDGDYYQDFSYELKSSVSIDRYYSILKHLVHPAGTKMFGSILLEDALSTTNSGSSQLTRVGVPVIGNYTPYTFGTTLDLRANGVTLSGSWLINVGGVTYGKTGDLYPLGYNPYIGGTAELGPNGKTAPLGTTFTAGGSGGNLGYTYCLVPESGRTAHDPLGGALGGVTAWSLNYENKLTPDTVGFTPQAINNLVLWLKPENIGVCGGSLITGRSMDIWRDASPSQNHAVPPKWDLWDGDTVLYARKRAGGNNWNESVWNTNPCDNIEFRVGNYGPPVQGISQANGNGFMVGFWGNVGGGNTAPLGTGGNVTNDGYKRLDFSIYILAYDSGAPKLSAYEIGRTGGGGNISLAGDGVLGSYTTSTIFGLSHDKVNNTVNYYRKDTLDSTPTLLRSPGVSAGEVFYADSSWLYPTSNCQIVKAQNDGVDLPISGWTGTSNMQFVQVKGLTVDKLRPTLIINDRGIAGRTGIEFNGGVLYGPHTVWTQAGLCGGYAGVTLGANGVAPFVSGFTGERIQTARFFTLTRGLSLTKDMTAFIVFRAGPTGAAGYTASNYGLGLVSSSKPLYNFSPSVEQTRTNVLSNTADLSNTTNWPSAISGTGVTPTRTYGVFDPLGTKTATRFVLNKGAGTNTTDMTLVLQSLPSTMVSGSTYGGFLWVKGIAAGGTLAFRHAAGSNYLLIPVTTSWRKHYVQEIAASTPQNFGFGLRGGYGTSDSLTVDIWSPELFAGSGLSPFVGETDHLFYNRSYNNVDLDSTKKNSTNYFVNSGTNEAFYPYETGLVGFRNNVGSTAASRIAYNPYTSTLSGISLENISIGEWSRKRDSRIQSFYNGNESKNFSKEVSRRIARTDSPGGSSPLNFAASEVSYNGNTLDMGRFGAFCLPVLDANSTSASGFVNAALGNPSYSFNGVIYEVVVYDRVLTPTERFVVYSYLSRKYRLDQIIPFDFDGVASGMYPSAALLGYSYWDIEKHPNTTRASNILNNYALTLTTANTRFLVGETLKQNIPAGITIEMLQGISFAAGVCGEGVITSTAPNRLAVKVTKNGFIRGIQSDRFVVGSVSGATASLSGVSLATASFGEISVEDFVNLYGLVYKSEGTKLADGTVLTQDTYDRLGD